MTFPRYRSLAIVVAFVVPLFARAQTPSPDSSEARTFPLAVKGQWKGTLEYRDYSNDKRVKLPTSLDAKPGADGLAAILQFRYDEGRGRFVEETDTVRIDPALKSLTWESNEGKSKTEYTVAGFAKFAEKGRGELILTGTGVENDKKVDVRKTIVVKDNEITILKETRVPGEPFAFRNQYSFQRVEPKS